MKKLTYNEEARKKIQKGADALADAVKVTLGPKGRNVIIERGQGAPIITKDGVTVAKEIFLEDEQENIGAQIIKQVASKTMDVTGDGTTTATVLAQAILTAGLKNVTAGANPMDLKRGIDKAVAAVVKDLKKQSIPVAHNSKSILHVATVSANNDSEIGKLIAGAMGKIKKDGIITVEESNNTETFTDVIDGMQFGRGYISPYFVTHADKMQCIYEKPYILFTNGKISNMQEFLPILQMVNDSKRPFVIIAEDVEGEVLQVLCYNRMQRAMPVVAIKAPSFGDKRKALTEDMAILTGGTFLTEEAGTKLESIDLNFLGQAKKVIVTRDSTIIIGGNGDKTAIAERTASIKTLITDKIDIKEKDFLQNRISRLNGGVAVLYVGAATDVEMKEKKDRIDDALHATKAAVDEGIVAGGGVAYIRAIDSLGFCQARNADELTGINIIREALESPLRTIINNSGTIKGEVIIAKVKEGKGDYGFNAYTEKYENLIAAGVIDPTKVSRVALENAASISGLILTTECVISNLPPKK